MNAHKLIAIALAALLVFAGGAAALPDQASDAAEDNQPDEPGVDAAGQADENATDDDAAENETETAENETEDEDARDENASAGPPTDLPEQAPDHVTQIHDLIRSKLDGALTGQELGAAISDLMGSDEGAGEQTADAASQSENASETDNDATDASENAQSNAENAGPPADLPGQAADHVAAIHDAVTSWLNGDGDGNPGEAVSSTAG
ncbi:MAG: hypothetical protein ABEH59_11865 [Halobacteriales archaeon]